MKKWLLLITLVFPIILFAQPVIDGNFDGEAVWGSPKATADGLAGWAGANAKKLYVTYDDTYVYVGAEVTASPWQAWAFLINTKSGGGSTESWSRSIIYGHSNLPDYIMRGHFDGYAEFHTWNGSSWSGTGSALASTEFGENITSNDQDGWVEARILKTAIDNANIGDIQFYITGDNNDHATFDACPDDENTTGWIGITTTLDNYANNVPLPVELTSFTANVSGKRVTLNWTTATEINNYGFEVERKQAQGNWNKIGFVNGHGNSNSAKEYSYTDKGLAPGKYLYRLKQIDTDGTYEYSNEVEAEIIHPKEFVVEQNYPNPFNPETSISFALPQQSHVKVTIFNILGQEIETLVNETREAGQHTIDFNADGLNSGVYLYKIEAGSFVQVKKMILNK